MFSWICPQCGKDVPPSKSECPHCAERAKEFAAQQALHPQQPPAAQQSGYGPAANRFPEAVNSPNAGYDFPPQRTAYDSPPQRTGYDAPPQFDGGVQRPIQTQPPPPIAQPYPPPPQGGQGQWSGQQQYPMPPGQPPQGQHMHGQPPHWGPQAQRSGPPTWLLSVAFALAILGIGAAVYFGVQRFGKTNPQERAGLENPANPSKSKVANPLQKYVEVVGIRLVGDARKKPVAKFVVVNHSNTEIDGLAANVTLWASTSRSEEDSVASFSFKLPRLGANESKELTESLKTKLKLYELPDWQNANADIQITAP